MKPSYERPLIQKLNAGLLNKFGSRTEYTPVKQIDGISVNDLMDRYGSPLFVISETTIRRTYQRALKAFKVRYPKVQFAWSYKTNYLDAVCKIFHQEGSWAEVVSRFEYDKAIRNGVPGNLIIFNGPDKIKEDLKTAVVNRSLIHIDHFDELYTLIEMLDGTSDKARVAIRVNMDTGIYPQWDRFGFNYESGQAWNAIMKIAAQQNLELEGLHWPHRHLHAHGKRLCGRSPKNVRTGASDGGKGRNPDQVSGYGRRILLVEHAERFLSARRGRDPQF